MYEILQTLYCYHLQAFLCGTGAGLVGALAINPIELIKVCTCEGFP